MKDRMTMNKEYISPEILIVKFFFDSTILSASVKEPVLEDFDVSDGEW